MRTPEEILHKPLYPDQCGTGIKIVMHYECISAMHEYAEEMLCEFVNYCKEYDMRGVENMLIYFKESLKSKQP